MQLFLKYTSYLCVTCLNVVWLKSSMYVCIICEMCKIAIKSKLSAKVDALYVMI